MSFLLQSLTDLNNQLKLRGGKLYLFRGDPVDVFRKFKRHVWLNSICFEQDCEPIWAKRDNSVKEFCERNGVRWMEEIAHTLWNPKEVIAVNQNEPPLTYQKFMVN